ncbi:synergin gamma-like isoform X2 [Stegodyphus dumicola]|uniref:synergin gamma-like isoform X2 n=1 Tax=Stegodyphus dumicola TaxID=202533 RepID=UPI0015AE8AE6|nr:synergin gamma-like isoform X2 [Stegodyphus dumicola]
MSLPFRQPFGAPPPTPNAHQAVPSKMMPPVCTTGPPVFPVMPNTFGLVPTPPPQYVTQPMMYSQPLVVPPSRVPVVAGIPSPVPAMYIPVSPVPLGINTTNADPAKLLEEQKRIEKERNFQLQQQRLKQFTVAGKKGSLNADNLIDSMFGKLQPKKTNPASTSSLKPIDINSKSQKSNCTDENVLESCRANEEKKENIQQTSRSQSQVTSSNFSQLNAKDVKELSVMMLECSDLSRPQKANTFQKQLMKDLSHASQQKATFTASNKARDWRNVQGLNDVFILPKSRFPNWCTKEIVPELYKKIEACVTANGLHAPDTNLLFPILMSSGLSREVLGHIWELVSGSAIGHLTTEEMYAALALIAVAQAGHPINSIDILHQLPTCPSPQLHYFSSPSQSHEMQKEVNSPLLQMPSCDNLNKNPVAAEQSEMSGHQVLRPVAISFKDSSVSDVLLNVSKQSVPSLGNVNSSGFVSSPDDEFDDFKSATPTAVNFSIHTPSSDQSHVEDEFDDFKHAELVIPSSNAREAQVKNSVSTAVTNSISTTVAFEQDLMSPEEDKYSVFRSLQGTEESSCWSSFTSASKTEGSSVSEICSQTTAVENSSSSVFPTVIVIKSNCNTDLPKIIQTDVKSVVDDDEFGEFLHADISSAVITQTESTNVTQPECLNSNFADFTNFKDQELHETSSLNAVTSSVDDEFGEFASSLPVSYKPESQDFLFHHVKDNISLAESQSVSSLELGTFDGGGHSGESKSSLSRQGSIPSLDLKSICLEGADSEDCFTELQAHVFTSRGSKSPSPAKDLKASDCSSSLSVGMPFQTTSNVPLADKYSVIRLEEKQDEDQHISSWLRCLQSSVDILLTTKKIFNQMSCSSVCNEVLNSEEGENYVKNVIEVYRVVCRIALSSKSSSKQTAPILNLLNEADEAWNTICGFLAGSALMPEEKSLDFSNGVLRPDTEDNTKACGLCLLNVDIKNYNKDENLKLSYGGRNYHSTCANLWVNCVDPLLPALTLPHLL